jgi:NADH-quinone oxidoreductase subunit E
MSMPCGAIAADGVLDRFPDKRAELDAYLSSLGLGDSPERNRSFLIQSLHKAQGLYGFLAESVQLFVANRLRLHLSEVYGVISFYSFFTDRPRGRYRIAVCTGTACYVKGAAKLVDEFKHHLAIDEGETTENGLYSLGGLRCVGACSLAPVVMVNDKVYGHVTPAMVPEIIAACAPEEERAEARTREKVPG